MNNTKHIIVYCTLAISFLTCNQKSKTKNNNIKVSEDEISVSDTIPVSEENSDYIKLFKEQPKYVADGFDSPVGKPNARGYYNAQKFQVNNHLADDWNGVGGGNSDLGDPIYAVANGYITEVKDHGAAWGNVLRIVHLHKDKFYETLYAHCDTIIATPNTFVKKGTQIATIGNCNGLYWAHLHLELRNKPGLVIGTGYSKVTTGYLDPTDFITKNRD